jgi:phospholipase/carboxylesterase
MRSLLSTNTLSLIHLLREPIKAPPSAPPLLLLLHGVGSNEADLFGLAPYLDERFLIVSARAPQSMGPGAYGWFNIDFTPQGLIADVDQAQQSLRLLPGFIDELIRTYRVNEGCVYLMGFSQGAMMSLALALTRPDKIAGVVVMSGRFPSEVLAQGVNQKALERLPILVTHGVYDPVLPIEHGRTIRKNLAGLPVELTYLEYPMGHEVSLDSLKDASAWLSKSLDVHCAA